MFSFLVIACFLRQGLTNYPRLTLNLTPFCLSSPTTGIRGTSYHAYVYFKLSYFKNII